MGAGVIVSSQQFLTAWLILGKALIHVYKFATNQKLNNDGRFPAKLDKLWSSFHPIAWRFENASQALRVVG